MRARLGLVLVVALSSPSLAWAGDADDEAAATELFNAGRDRMKHGDYAGACPKLAESARLKPTVGALAKLGECEEHEQRLVSAYARWQQALNLARSLGDERVGDVERAVARLDAVVPKLRVVAAGALPPDATIALDEMELGTASLGVPLAVEPGIHTVRAGAPHKRSWSTTVAARADGATTAVTVPELEDAPESPPAPTPTLPPPLPPVTPPLVPPATNPWPTAGLVAGSLGLGAVAVGGAFGLDALRRRDDAHCAGAVCPDATSAATLRDAKTSASWSTALLVAGGVLVAGGATVWWLTKDPAGKRVGLAPTIGGVLVAGWWDGPTPP